MKHLIWNKLKLAWRNDDNVNRHIHTYTHSHDHTRNRIRYFQHQTIINNSPEKNATNKGILKGKRSNSYGRCSSEKSWHTHSDRRREGGRDLVENCMASKMVFPSLSSNVCRYECLFVCLLVLQVCACVCMKPRPRLTLCIFLCLYIFWRSCSFGAHPLHLIPFALHEATQRTRRRDTSKSRIYVLRCAFLFLSPFRAARLHTCMVLAGAVINHVHTCLAVVFFIDYFLGAFVRCCRSWFPFLVLLRL